MMPMKQKPTPLFIIMKIFFLSFTEKKAVSLLAKSFGILLMHHQPAVIENQDLFRQITKERNLRLILSGHLHPTNTMFYKVDSCAVITGMAITPQYDWIPSGFQIIHISTRGKVVVKPVLL